MFITSMVVTLHTIYEGLFKARTLKGKTRHRVLKVMELLRAENMLSKEIQKGSSVKNMHS